MSPAAAVRSAGEAIGFGGRPAVRLLRWSHRVNAAKTQLAFFSVQMPSGLIIRGMGLMVGPKGRPFIAMPSIKQSDGSWSDILDFPDRATRDRFAEPIVALLKREHPEAFE